MRHRAGSSGATDEGGSRIGADTESLQEDLGRAAVHMQVIKGVVPATSETTVQAH